MDIAASLPLFLPLLRRWKKPAESRVSYPMKISYVVRSCKRNFRKQRDDTSRDLEEDIHLARSCKQSSEKGGNREGMEGRSQLEWQTQHKTSNVIVQGKDLSNEGVSENQGGNSCTPRAKKTSRESVEDERLPYSNGRGNAFQIISIPY